ncbi:hypothetical protein SAMN07250955_11443 [Arboricoccus pini]|uniref:Uncharacterized protein n=1 Tax=Arboricoccus pini TaxID=1963835 RepID=A0A212RTI6_9PROT|nr:hypothetical protein [Arboricoccus pini]SNB75952.1 hypothetical protein SAMN07250955_11443 [Arboricoccus pini]
MVRVARLGGVGAIALSLLSWSLAASAASPVGSWVIDRPAWEAESQKAVERLTPVVPPAQLALLKQAGMDPAQLVRQGIGDMSQAELELGADGSAVAHNFRNHTYKGTWTETDDKIVLEFRQDKARMFGHMEGDRLILKADPSTLKPQAAAMVADLEFPLLRKP